MTFPYLKKVSAYPFIPIKLYGPKKIWHGKGLVDSGAVRSLCNSEIADFIGVDLSKAKIERFFGIGQEAIPVKSATIELEVLGIRRKVKVKFGFVEGLAPVLLGQDGFFDNFVIKFNRARDIIEIT